jgi:hypothetical protein
MVVSRSNNLVLFLLSFIKLFSTHLFQAIGRRFLKVSVKDAFFQRRWVRHITVARTTPVCYEYVIL